MTLPGGPVRALVFDVDGTLAETEEAHRAAFNAAFADAGLPWSWDRAIYARLLKVAGGKERIAHWQETTGDRRLDWPGIARLHKAKTAVYAGLVASGALTLRPGVAELVAAAPARGLRLAIATTTSRPNIEALVRACWGRPTAEVFEVIAAGDEVPAKKPAPDVYLLALSRLGLPAGQALALEDSPIGIASARAAGMRVVAAPGVYTAGEDLSAATLVLPDLSHLVLP